LINEALQPLVQSVRESGLVPKARDARFDAIAETIGTAPHSLRFHLKECLMGHEIHDQRLEEMKDLVEALSTAKQEYHAQPTVHTAGAYAQLLTQFRGLADDIEGQTDPEVTVEYIVESVLSPLTRRTLSSMAEELRNLRENAGISLSQKQLTHLDSYVKTLLSSLSSALRDGLDESLKLLCDYYKVELEVKARRRALESAVATLAEPDYAPSLTAH
jgi:hypothetical protein